MVIKLRTKLALTHGLIAAVTIFLVVFASYLLINERFINYVSDNNLAEHEALVQSLSNAYANGQWNVSKVNRLSLDALHAGYFVRLFDTDGETLWEPGYLSEEEYSEATIYLSERLDNHFGLYNPRPQLKTYDVLRGSTLIGRLELQYYNTFFLTDHDLMFLKYLNNSMLWVSGISLLLALIISTLLSNSISAQLTKIIRATKSMVNGAESFAFELDQSNLFEIKELGKVVKGLEKGLLEKEASNKRLTADIAHELRTPLSTLQSHLEALLEGIWQPTQERLSSCFEELVRMSTLVDDLEQLNKYDTDQIKLTVSSFDINELVKNICLNFQGDFHKKQVSLRFLGVPCEMTGDREKIAQVVVNLLSNSLKYTPTGGEVYLHMQYDKNYIYIIVNDNGVGIPEKDLPFVFDRLYRADLSRTRTTGGAGIGLSIAKAVVESHQGQINVVSQEGKGTEFTVILPKDIYRGDQ